MAELSERETTVTYTAADDLVRIYTCIRRDITALKKKDQFTVESEGRTKDGTPYCNFTIPVEKFNLANAAKRTLNLSEEEKQIRRERFEAARAKRGNTEA